MQPFQWLATPIAPTPTLIEASAGTGKTYAITGLVLRLLLEGHVEQVRQILVVTFTKAATRELTQRIRLRLREALAAFRGEREDASLQTLIDQHGEKGKATLAKACLELEELSIFTIHGFCRRMLEQNAFESGLTFSPTFLEDHRAILDEAARDFWRRTFLEGPPLLAELAVVRKWSPASLLKTMGHCRSNHEAHFFPKTESLQSMVQDLENALTTMQAAWQREPITNALQTLDFVKKHEPFPKEDVIPFIQSLENACSDAPKADSLAAVLKVHRQFRPEHLKKKQQSQANILDLLELPFFAHCRLIGDLIEQLEISLRVTFLQKVEAQFQVLKNRSHQLDFDDLLQQMYDVLIDPNHGPAIRLAVGHQYQAALIDEFQDTDRIQFEIFHRLFPKAPLFFIGDPKQAIYSFRGADLHAYLAARKVTGQRYTLNTNWRSHKQLVDAVNQLFLAQQDPFLDPDIGYQAVEASGRADAEAIDDDGRAMHWWLIPDSVKGVGAISDLILKRMVKEIGDLIANGTRLGQRALQASDFAVLVRKNAQANEVLQALRAAGLPALVADSGDIFQSKEMEALFHFIRAVIHPQKPGRLQTAMAGLIWGANANDIAALNQDESQLREATTHLETLRNIWYRHGFLTMVHAAFSRLNTHQRLLSRADGIQCLTHLRHAAEVIEQFSTQASVTPEGLLRWLQKEKTKPTHEGLDTQLRMATSENAIQILTVHKSKGLEYQIVFCPFLWKGQPTRHDTIPKYHNDAGELLFDLQPKPTQESREKASREQLAEDLRLLYVALTRARQRCYLAWGIVARQHQPALASLLIQEDRHWPTWLEQNSDLMKVETLSLNEPQTPPNYKPAQTNQASGLQPARLFQRQTNQLNPWRISSFTSLTYGHDSKTNQDHSKRDRLQESGSGIFGFARGARTGNCLHEILEHLDFGDIQAESTQDLIKNTLIRFDLYEPQKHTAAIDPQAEVSAMLRRVCQGRLPGLSFSLSDLGEGSRLNEWAFHLPFQQFQSSDFFHYFNKFAADKVRNDYGPRLQHWTQETRLDGFLTGIVDLCFVHENRWYLIDWKSNDLGPGPSYYDQPGLWQAMCDHHYVLQYHLYLLALHRFLQSRLPNYQFETHIGGVFYAFLRGIDGRSQRGWFSDRPDYQLVQALDQMCQGGDLS